MKEDIECYPYKPKILEVIHEKDFELGKKFALKMINSVTNYTNILSNMCFFDEAHFHLTGYVNKKNMRLWTQSNPNYTIQTQLNHKKLFGAFFPQLV